MLRWDEMKWPGVVAAAVAELRSHTWRGGVVGGWEGGLVGGTAAFYTISQCLIRRAWVGREWKELCVCFTILLSSCHLRIYRVVWARCVRERRRGGEAPAIAWVGGLYFPFYNTTRRSIRGRGNWVCCYMERTVGDALEYTTLGGYIVIIF